MEVNASSNGSPQTRTLCEYFQCSKQLRKYVKTLLDSGRTQIACPVCDQKWAWQEVRALALLTTSDQTRYETKLLRMSRVKTESYKKCPGCWRLLQRLEVEDLHVVCPQCTRTGGEAFRVCWSCGRQWRGPAPGGGAHCSDRSCPTVSLLQSCPPIDGPSLAVNGCPSIRACPRCRALVAHAGGCKYVRCGPCSFRFCYRCLEPSKLCQQAKSGSYFLAKCGKPFAARQSFPLE
ncbi:probable E3 ubiquitin-protein ligase RNF217 isoform X2 [Amblyraja radiata]|uniref:probable E3 ubiquitin-protein ligase RNF217 isoform X2 n=1 Tax=Amblyraja radiata TaxID=386614 RepID=UPI0014041BF2|nr:probable E3 ubiquitin-protein ligase RNF217 isoform X2 [Amblyraja radiata]